MCVDKNSFVKRCSVWRILLKHIFSNNDILIYKYVILMFTVNT